MRFKLYAAISVFVLLFSTFNQAFGQDQQQTVRDIQALLKEKNTRTPVQQKIESQLLQGLKESRGQIMAEGVRLQPIKLKTDNGGLIKVDISAAVSDALLTRIEALGGKILYPSWQYKTIRAEVKLSQVEAIAAFPEVKFIEPAVEAVTVGSNRTNNVVSADGSDGPFIPGTIKGKEPVKSTFEMRAARVRTQLENYLRKIAAPLPTGSVNSQGDRAHRADDVRNTYGYAGQGIKIGVISDSYNSLGVANADVLNGNLPGVGNPIGNLTPVTVVADFTPATDEGRAMTQIVHDLAPKAQLFFATANQSEAGFAANIVALRNTYNCDVIIDDIFYYDEPVFQDGIVAQAVNTVTAAGALYFSSAGNEGSVSKNTSGYYEGDFNDAGSPAFTFPGGAKAGTIHNFGTLATPINGDIIVAAANRYTLNWSDAAGSSANDYDLFVVSSAGVVKAQSTNIQNGTQNPFEQIVPGTLVAGDRLVVFKTAASATRAFSLNNIRGRLSVFTTGQTHGHSAAVQAMSVSATPAEAPFTVGTTAGPFPGAFNAGNKVETFSSDGPRRVFYNPDGTQITPGNLLFGTNGGTVRNKPDITAADGVGTTLASSSGLNPFYGTSAAAPHAGAIAALLKSANPALTATQIKTILVNTALDIEAPGYDNLSGNGIVQAFQAMQAVNPVPVSNIILGTTTITEGTFSNSNGSVDPGETGNAVIQLTNPSLVNATAVTAVLTTTTPGVTIIQGVASYGTIPSGASANNATPYQFAVNSSVACGTVINFTLTVTFGGGGVSPQVFLVPVTIGSQTGLISSTLGLVPPTGPTFTSTSGQQIGRATRTGVVSTCAAPKAPVGLTVATGSRQYDAYKFTNTNAAAQCVTVTMNSSNGINLFAIAYNNAGFDPTNPGLNYLADPGSSSSVQTFSFNAPPGQSFTVVVHDVNVIPTSGSAYTLSVSLAACAIAPPCTPVVITTPTIAPGATGVAYSQSFTATGGSGSYTFSLTGALPAGLTFSGNTLSGTPTQAGSFPIVITASDAAGCPAGTQNYTLVIAGAAPATVTATAGTPQSTIPGTAFAVNLQATVRDATNNLLAGVNVVFTAPTVGPSGTFTGGLSTVTVVTNASGVATAPTFTANNNTGTYTVTATVIGIATPANFLLTNACPATFVVTTNADNGAGSLREIVTNACPGITVTFAAGVNLITLTSGEIPITKAITITGPGAGNLTISGNNASRIFNISAGTATVSISGMTIRNGKPAATSANGGAGILINNGASVGIVNLTGLNITNNDASLPANSLGAGIDNEGGTVNIDRCAVVSNIATFRGGGIQNQGFGSMVISNSTIANNTAGTAGIGGAIRSFLPLTVTNSTIFGNSALSAGNVSVAGGTFTFGNTIIAGGVLIGVGGTGPDVSGTAVSTDYNLIQSLATATITGVTTNNITGVSPNLLPLGNYGGPTQTLIPQPTSPVVNAGDVALLTGTDQRGFPRLIGARADIGAVEVNYTIAATAGTPQTTFLNAAFPVALQTTVKESGNPVAGVTVTFTAPGTGASGTFPGAVLTAAAVTNASGIATAPTFTANNTFGTYNVVSSIGALFGTATHVLTNGDCLITFTTQPTSKTACAGDNVTFTVVATNALTYQWLVNTGSGFVIIPGANFSTLVLNNVTTAMNGYIYQVRVTSGCQTQTSSNATLTVSPLPVVSIAALPATICSSDTLVALSGSPVGGSFSGLGVSGFNFVPLAVSTGVYTITYSMTNTLGCTAKTTTVAKVQDCPDRVRLLRNNAAIVYPNPNNGRFNIRINSTLYSYLGMNIYTQDGQLVRTQNFNGLVYGRVIAIDVTSLPAATYIVKLYYDDGVRSSDKGFKVIVGGH